MSLNFDYASSDCLDWILINCLLGFQQRTLCHIPRRTQVSSNFTDGFCAYSRDANEVWCACHWLPNTVRLHWWAVIVGVHTGCVAECTASRACLFTTSSSHSFFCSSDGCGLATALQLRDCGGLCLFPLDRSVSNSRKGSGSDSIEREAAVLGTTYP